MMRLGGWEVILILLVVVIIFGPKKLPGLGKGLAEFFKNFKGGLKEVKKETKEIEENINS